MKNTQVRLEAIETGNPQSRNLLPEFEKVQVNDI